MFEYNCSRSLPFVLLLHSVLYRMQRCAVTYYTPKIQMKPNKSEHTFSFSIWFTSFNVFDWRVLSLFSSKARFFVIRRVEFCCTLCGIHRILFFSSLAYLLVPHRRYRYILPLYQNCKKKTKILHDTIGIQQNQSCIKKTNSEISCMGN